MLRYVACGVCAAIGLAATSTPAMANPQNNDERGPQWNQRLQRWERLPPERRDRILREQQRYQQLSPQEKRRLIEQYRQQRP